MTELLAQFDSEMQAEMKKDNVEHQIRDFVQSVDMNDFAEVIYNYPFGYVYEETLKDYVISEINKGRLNPNNYNFNAGIDVLGAEGSASLSAFRNDPLVSGVIMLLIVMGGLGFLVWDDLMRNFFRPRRLRLCTSGQLPVLRHH